MPFSRLRPRRPSATAAALATPSAAAAVAAAANAANPPPPASAATAPPPPRPVFRPVEPWLGVGLAAAVAAAPATPERLEFVPDSTLPDDRDWLVDMRLGSSDGDDEEMRDGRYSDVSTASSGGRDRWGRGEVGGGAAAVGCTAAGGGGSDGGWRQGLRGRCDRKGEKDGEETGDEEEILRGVFDDEEAEERHADAEIDTRPSPADPPPASPGYSVPLDDDDDVVDDSSSGSSVDDTADVADAAAVVSQPPTSPPQLPWRPMPLLPARAGSVSPAVSSASSVHDSAGSLRPERSEPATWGAPHRPRSYAAAAAAGGRRHRRNRSACLPEMSSSFTSLDSALAGAAAAGTGTGASGGVSPAASPGSPFAFRTFTDEDDFPEEVRSLGALPPTGMAPWNSRPFGVGGGRPRAHDPRAEVPSFASRRDFSGDKATGAKGRIKRLARKLSSIVPAAGRSNSNLGSVSTLPSFGARPDDSQQHHVVDMQSTEQSWRLGCSMRDVRPGGGKTLDRNERYSWRPMGSSAAPSRFDDYVKAMTPTTLTPTTSESGHSATGADSSGHDIFSSRKEFRSFGGWRNQPTYSANADSSSVESSDCDARELRKQSKLGD